MISNHQFAISYWYLRLVHVFGCKVPCSSCGSWFVEAVQRVLSLGEYWGHRKVGMLGRSGKHLNGLWLTSSWERKWKQAKTVECNNFRMYAMHLIVTLYWVVNTNNQLAAFVIRALQRIRHCSFCCPWDLEITQTGGQIYICSDLFCMFVVVALQQINFVKSASKPASIFAVRLGTRGVWGVNK